MIAAVGNRHTQVLWQSETECGVLTRKAAGMERDKLLGTMDAKVWTDEFMATKARLGDEEFDHAMMLAWFANAIMAGFDEANRCAQRALDAPLTDEQRAIRDCCEKPHDCKWGGLGGCGYEGRKYELKQDAAKENTNGL